MDLHKAMSRLESMRRELLHRNGGGGEIATQFDLNPSFPEILTGIILFCIIGCEFFIHYSIRFRHKKQADAADVAVQEKEADK